MAVAEPVQRSRARHAILLFLAMFVIYNANGREIASYDSQPPKFTALAIVRDHTTRLDPFIEAAPLLAERPGFAKDQQGHWRSAYPPIPGLIAGIVGLFLHATGVWDPGAPLAAASIAKLTASLLTALAVTFIYLAARRRTSDRVALFVSVGAGLGTNLWAQTSQTLWQGETAVAALAAAVWLMDRPERSLATMACATAALGIAGAARAQLAPAIVVLLLAIVWRGRWRGLLSVAPIAIIAAATIGANLHWFGHPLGARPQLEAAASVAHAVTGPVGNPLVGAAGLLISPNRGILIFSPVVAIALGALVRWGMLPHSVRWFAVAAGIQFCAYASYSAWWGGHSYGPRLLLDAIPLIAPLAACSLPWWVVSTGRKVAAAVMLFWSVLLAGTGAFVFPNERWNSSPVDVDRHHERLWDWRDLQFQRCWTAGPDPRNFSIFSREAFKP